MIKVILLSISLLSISIANSQVDSTHYKYKFDLDVGQLLFRDIRASFGFHLTKNTFFNLEAGHKFGNGVIFQLGGTALTSTYTKGAQTWNYGSLGLELNSRKKIK